MLDSLTHDWTETRLGSSFELPEQVGRYRKIRLLVRGGMGSVFLVHDTELDRPVALKVLSRGDDLREARASSRMRHPNLCPVYDVGEIDGIPFFTMAFIEGGTLAQRSARRPLDTTEAIRVTRTVALAMHEAHLAGTIHRDLKPANILLDAFGEPVISDFGVARRMGEASTASIVGTPAYMSPEQACGDPVGIAGDIYSLGVIFFELIASRRPFEAERWGDLQRLILAAEPPKPSDYYPWLSRTLDEICARALAKNPADRFATMAEFARALPG
jgi:serine/threonine-protein kinase